MKKPRLSVVEKIQAKQEPPQIAGGDLQNVMVAANLGMQHLTGQDRVNVAVSMGRLEALIAAMSKAQPAPLPPAIPAAAEG